MEKWGFLQCWARKTYYEFLTLKFHGNMLVWLGLHWLQAPSLGLAPALKASTVAPSTYPSSCAATRGQLRNNYGRVGKSIPQRLWKQLSSAPVMPAYAPRLPRAPPSLYSLVASLTPKIASAIMGTSANVACPDAFSVPYKAPTSGSASNLACWCRTGEQTKILWTSNLMEQWRL